jgi:molybdate transport system substrate-binding protein
MQKHWRIGALCLLAASAIAVATARAADVDVAVAANFKTTLERLKPMFEATYAGRLVISAASTGQLYAQIANGAPYDIFLAADVARPRRLEQDGIAVAGTRFTFALGKLVLWSPKAGFVDDQGRILATGHFRRLAMAEPKTAPYGEAAQEVLTHLGLWENLQARIARGQNVGQTLQFVYSGNADVGFVALAQVLDLPARSQGSYWIVPQSLYTPIEQQAVLLRRAVDNPDARAFLTFLRGDRARAEINTRGYGLPGSL